MMRFDAIGIVVADMGKALAFYRLLGLDAPLEADGEGHVEVEVVPGFRVMFDTIEVIERFATYEAPSGGRAVSFAVRCDSPAAVDTCFVSVIEAGHVGEAEPFDAFWGQRYATVVDPDGNSVDLYAELQGELENTS
ncbi:MAG: VOC family protein [Gaiellaceae bacterium]